MKDAMGQITEASTDLFLVLEGDTLSREYLSDLGLGLRVGL